MILNCWANEKSSRFKLNFFFSHFKITEEKKGEKNNRVWNFCKINSEIIYFTVEFENGYKNQVKTKKKHWYGIVN